MLEMKDFKSGKALKDKVRETVFADMLEMYIEKYGEENVSIVNKSEIAVCVNTVLMPNGQEYEICCTIKPVMKDFDDRKTPTKVLKAYQRIREEEAYEVDKQASEKKAEEKARRNAEKKRKDFERRAKAKAEKAKAEKAKA